MRFNPPSQNHVHRRHLEELFSDIGPIKKCSVIQSDDANSKSYGFVKFLTDEDAQQAAKVWNNKVFKVFDKSFTLNVQVATEQTKKKEYGKVTSTLAPTQISPNADAITTTPEAPEELLAKRKRTCRVMVRNLSFYAKEHHVKATLEQEFGPVLEVQLPRVTDQTHRGFCFVTFLHPKDAQKSTEARSTPLLISKRPVAIDYAVPKKMHQMQKEQQHKAKVKKEEEKGTEESEEVDNDEEENGSEKVDDEVDDDGLENDDGLEVDDDGSKNDDDEKEAEATESDSDEDEEELDDPEISDRKAPTNDEGVSHHQTLFIRNLPFDTTRHDVFQLMHKFGHIESIFLVKDKETGVFKGTCFLQYKTAEAAARALEHASSTTNNFVSQKDGTTDSTGLQLNGRRLYCDYAVDKSTASTLTLEHQEKVTGKDRRNMYLKTEGRVANLADLPGNTDNSAWESIPESDQIKRQRAFMEKNTKLRSPLFFINPKRLSIRNLAKHVDEAALKKLVVEATVRGLSKSLVNQDDQVAHWRATGDMTTRDLLKKLENTEQIIPELNEKNIKESIPSVFIDRDFTSKKSELGQSRGFGFVDFTHHIHALACLRELNNNSKYSVDFVASGKKGNAKQKELVTGEAGRKAPRLIVDFTVENSAKAKKQAENRAQQQANKEQQRVDQKVKKAEKKTEKKLSRGALQREKKRKARDEGTTVKPVKERSGPKAHIQEPVVKAPKIKNVKPPKKRKLDNEEQTFERLVQSYTESFSNSIKKSDGESADTKPKKAEKRWFE